LDALPGADSEVESSRRFYASSVVLAGAAATTSRVSAAMPGAGMLHFASHARFDAERPEQSRLVLAPDDAGRDGLSAQTISGMSLSGVRLAVLSSCESTRSGIADAPFTIGLAKAFHDAGVPSVVGALWKVDDDATSALMTELHRRYSRTRNAAGALRDAQLAMLHDGRPDRRDPAAWGAFVLTGR
jgi:CHAT domain-containing protein